MVDQRKTWNEQQQALRRALTAKIPSGQQAGEAHQEAIALFLRQHAMVHAAGMSSSGYHSFQDEVLDGMSEDSMRPIPSKGEHSIAWVLWHIARIEDVTTNLLIAGSSQLLNQSSRDGGRTWYERLGVTARDTGNATNVEVVGELSAAVDLAALLDYRLAVGRRTREVVQRLQPQDLRRKVDRSRLAQVLAEGAVVEAASGLLDYWGGLKIAGLLLMPPTRHNFIHLNEALRIKRSLR